MTDVETEILEAGLNENIIRQISQKKGEPDWLLQFRLTLIAIGSPSPARIGRWCACPKSTISHSLLRRPDQEEKREEGIDPELMKTFEKLGIPLEDAWRWPAWPSMR